MAKRVRLKIFGKVQGVFFRQQAKDQAQQLGLVGWVKNEKDGTVLVEVEGEEEKVREFVSWCQRGPKSAKVDQIEKVDLDPKNQEKEFIITY